MVKADLVRAVCETAGTSRRRAGEVVQTILDELKASMLRGERIELRGFGVFVVKPRKLGVGRNPRTGEAVKILPGRTVRFKAAKAVQTSTG